MNKKTISFIIIILIFITILTGCKEENVKFDREVIIDGSLKISALMPSNNNLSNQIVNGISFANSLADSVKLDDLVSVDIEIAEYTDSNDICTKAQDLVDNGSSIIIYVGDDYNAFSSFKNFIDGNEIPIISLSPYTYEANNFFSLTLSPKFLSSCAATYSVENNFINPAIIVESTNDYYVDFLDTFKTTHFNLSGTEPTTITSLSDEENVVDYSKLDFIFLVTSESNREEEVSRIRSCGFTGEIMFNEVFDKSTVSKAIFSNCSLISKFEEDSSNNVSTVFSSMYSKENNIPINSISAATTYGYDAYMIAFEALKSFEANENSIFTDTDITETSSFSSSEIMLSDFSEAISNIKYIGVTDYITFDKNESIPTCIYVDKIIGTEVLFVNKYNFTSKI